MKKQYPLDIKSLNSVDLDAWFKDFELPYTMPELYGFRKKIEEEIFAIYVENRNTAYGEALLIEIKIFFEYLRVFYFLLYKQWSERMGYELLFDKTNFYNSFGTNEDNKVLDNLSQYGFKSGKGGLLSGVRRLLYGIRVNRSIFYQFKAIYESGRFIINTNPCTLSCAYSRKIKKNFIPFRENDLIGKLNFTGKISINADFDSFSTELSKRLCKKAKDFGVEIPDKIIFSLSCITANRLKAAYNDLKIVTEFFSSTRKMYLGFCGVQMGYFNRIVALALKRTGNPVYGFVHGYDYGRIRDYRAESSIVDKMVTYTKKTASDLNLSFLRFPPLQEKAPDSISADYDYFKNLCAKKQAIPNKIKRVMMICHCYDLVMNLDKGFPDITYFHLEITLMKFLVGNGFEILYKMHPEGEKVFTVRLLEKAFSGAVKVIKGRVEENSEEADAFLFYYTNSTTFAWATCSCKPVVIITSDEYVRSFSDEALRLIGRRCTIVPFHFNEKNIICFDKEILLNGLREFSKSKNSDFIETYMIP